MLYNCNFYAKYSYLILLGETNEKFILYFFSHPFIWWT